MTTFSFILKACNGDGEVQVNKISDKTFSALAFEVEKELQLQKAYDGYYYGVLILKEGSIPLSDEKISDVISNATSNLYIDIQLFKIQS